MPHTLYRTSPLRRSLIVLVLVGITAGALTFSRFGQHVQPLATAAGPPAITVNSTEDVVNGSDGKCTLREAITAANNNAASGTAAGECIAGSANDTISFDANVFAAPAAYTIYLTGALPNLSSNITINGIGSGRLTVRRHTGGYYRILTISGSVNVQIYGMTVSNGQTPDGQPGNFGSDGIDGGGISNFGSLTLTDVIVSLNATGKGGEGGIRPGDGGNGAGIYNFGTLTLLNCIVRDNNAGKSGDGGTISGIGGNGGGIYTESGTVTIINSTVSNNSAGSSGLNTNGNDGSGGGNGGGIYIYGHSTVQITSSTISDNRSGVGATTYHGYSGGIQNEGVLKVMNSTITGNVSQSVGGGVLNRASGVMTITNSTVSGNQGLSGGGITNDSSTVLTIVNCTVTNNSASGVYSYGNQNATVKNTIIAGNNGSVNATGNFNSQGYNLIGSALSPMGDSPTSGFVNGVKGDQVGTEASPLDPQLRPLGNYGGPTKTHLLLPGSPAINAGNNANLPQDTLDMDGDGDATEALPVDGRGYARVVNTTVDVGAVEVSDLNYVISVTAGSAQSASINTAFPLQLKATVTESGVPQSGIAVTFTAPADGAGGTFAASSTVITDANGVATSPVFTANGITGSYQVLASMSLGVPPVAFNLTNTKGQAQVTLGNLAQSYNGTPRSASVTTTPSGLTTLITYNGSQTAPTNAGNYQVVATVQDDNYFGQATGTLTINKAEQTISFGGPLNKTYGDPNFTVSATSSSNLGVTFTASGQCRVSGILVDLTGAGSCTITASQAGNNNYNPATPVSRTFTIAKATRAPVLSSSANPSDLGQSVIFTASVTGNMYTVIPTGTIQFKIDGANHGTPLPLNANGSTAFSISSLTAGAHPISAEYSGDANFNPSGGSLTNLQVVRTPPAISINDISITEGSAGTKNATFTATLSAQSNLTVRVDLATADGTAAAGSDYQAVSGTLTFNPSQTVRTFNIVLSADTANEPDETFFVNLSNPQNATILKGQGTGTILNDDSPFIQLASNSYTVSEGVKNTLQGYGTLTVAVNRTGDMSQAATVQYFTSDQAGGNECNQVTGQASQRCDYGLASGTLRFAPGEASKTISIPIVNDGYVENMEFFYLKLENATAAAVGAINQAAIAIVDDDTVATAGSNNPYLTNEFFVRMNYLDFLSREPDSEGWNTWTGVLNNCGPEKGFLGAPKNCDRAHVSHGFIASPEFTLRGYNIYRMYEVGLLRLPRYAEFVPDMAAMSGAPNSQELEQNTTQFAESFTNRQEFINRYADVSTPAQAALFIARLEQNAGVNLPESTTTLPGQPPQYNRQELINKRLSGELSLGQTLRAFVEQKVIYDRFFERGFVTMQYFGYLKRDPDLNDPNLSGWKEWVFVFTNGGGERNRPDILPRDYHHLVFGFIYSEEYRKRFGQP